jgi:hypothetical protein
MRERLYRIWGHMLDRCRNPKNDCFRYYGEIGITVCKEWAKLLDMPYRTIHRRLELGYTIKEALKVERHKGKKVKI